MLKPKTLPDDDTRMFHTTTTNNALRIKHLPKSTVYAEIAAMLEIITVVQPRNVLTLEAICAFKGGGF